MKIVGYYSFRGGAGSTTFASNTCIHAAERGLAVIGATLGFRHDLRHHLAHADVPWCDGLEGLPSHCEPGPTVAEHRPADGWQWFDMRKFPLKARRIDVPPIRGQIGALFEVAPAPELGAFMWALDYYGAIELGPIYLNMDDAQHGRGYLGILG